MLKKILLVLFITLISNNSFAFFWLFCKNTINGKNIHFCLPPFGRPASGDERSGCLRKFEIPGDFNFGKLPLFGLDQVGVGEIDACAENPIEIKDSKELFSEKNSNYYFDTSVRLRNQVNNLFAYWTNSKSLKNSECEIFAMGWGIPTQRFCARVTIPEGKDENGQTILNEKGAVKFPADPGYTQGVSLDHNGNELPDPEFETDDGKKFKVDPLKLCLYNDPGILQFEEVIISGILGFVAGGPYGAAAAMAAAALVFLDVMDYFPFYQPFHSGAAPPQFIVAIINMLNSQMALLESINPADIIFNKLSGSVPESMIPMLKQVMGVNNSREEFINFLTYFFSSNRLVKKNYGCVNIPIGPFPPKYCSELTVPTPSPEVSKICRTKSDGSVESNSERCCLSSKYDNNAISNTIRVGIDRVVPICSNTVLSNCIKVKGVIDPKTTHFANRDILNKCTANNSNNCVDAEPICQELGITCRDNLRPVYAIRNSKSVLFSANYYISEKNPLTGVYENKLCTNTDPTCKEVVYAVNLGDYQDINLDFSTSANQTLIKKDFTLNIGNKNLNFMAQVGSEVGKYQEKNQICAYNVTKDFQIGCVERGDLPIPIVSEIPNKYTSDALKKNFYFTPEMSIAVKIDSTDPLVLKNSYSVSKDVIAKSKNSPNNTGFVDIALNKYNTFVTDNLFRNVNIQNSNCKNFTDTSKLLVCGDYFENKDPLTSNGDKNNGIFYIDGLEKLPEYRRGGEFFCVEENQEIPKCDLLNKNMCVLAKCENGKCVNSDKTFANTISMAQADRVYPMSNIDNIRSNNLYYDPLYLIKICNPIGIACGDKISEYSLYSTFEKQYNSFPFFCLEYRKGSEKCYSIDFQNKAMMRTKNMTELGMCIKINQDWAPKCQQQVINDAIIPVSTIGKIDNSKITCNSTNLELKPTSATTNVYCALDDNNNNAIKISDLTNFGCQAKQCAQQTINGVVIPASPLGKVDNSKIKCANTSQELKLSSKSVELTCEPSSNGSALKLSNSSYLGCRTPSTDKFVLTALPNGYTGKIYIADINKLSKVTVYVEGCSILYKNGSIYKTSTYPQYYTQAQKPNYSEFKELHCSVGDDWDFIWAHENKNIINYLRNGNNQIACAYTLSPIYQDILNNNQNVACDIEIKFEYK